MSIRRRHSRPEERGATRTRLLLLFLLTTTLLFSGLWLRELRLGIEERKGIEASLQQAAAVKAQLSSLEQQLRQGNEALGQANALVALMAEPGTVRWKLDGEGSRGQAFFHPERKAVLLFTFDLKPPDASQAYQAWAKTLEGTVSSLGMLIDGGGNVRSVLAPAPAGTLSGIEVTLEPAGGSPSPTGPVALAGDLPAG